MGRLTCRTATTRLRELALPSFCRRRTGHERITPQFGKSPRITVSLDGRAVLISGPSGSGKSDLALRLLDRGFTLVSDDRTIVRKEGSKLIASAPATIKGKLEIRGVGIVEMDTVSDVPVAYGGRIDQRHPAPARRCRERPILGTTIPLISVDAMTASAPSKVAMALDRLGLKFEDDGARRRPRCRACCLSPACPARANRPSSTRSRIWAGTASTICPTALLEDFVHGEREARQTVPIAVGMDVRSRGFDPCDLPGLLPVDQGRDA